MQDTGKWIEDDREDIALGEVSQHCAGKSGPLEPEAALLYTELCAGKGENGFMKINRIVSCKKKVTTTFTTTFLYVDLNSQQSQTLNTDTSKCFSQE
jgi:hypothetical protein